MKVMNDLEHIKKIKIRVENNIGYDEYFFPIEMYKNINLMNDEEKKELINSNKWLFRKSESLAPSLGVGFSMKRVKVEHNIPE